MSKNALKSLTYEFEKDGNGWILYTLVTKNVTDTSANKSVYQARILGAEQYSL